LYYRLTKNLSEAESGVDFNGDGDQLDKFTSHIRGVVYAVDRFIGLQADGGSTLVRFTGTVLADEIKLYGAGCIFQQDPDLSTNLVNQFQRETMKLVPGSIRLE
jgi:hypothetical protein